MKVSRRLLAYLLVSAALLAVIWAVPALALDPQPEPPMLIQVEVDGNPLGLDVPPIIQDGRTLIPLRAIFEALGAAVEWNAADRTILGSKSGITVQLQIGSPTAYVNGAQVMLDVPPQILEGRTLVPVRFVSEAMGATVNWLADTRTVMINSGGTPSETGGTPPSTEIPTDLPTVPLVLTTERIGTLANRVHSDFYDLVLVQKLPLATALAQQKSFLTQQAEVKAVTEVPGSNLFVEFQDGYQLLMLLGQDRLGGAIPAAYTISPTISPTITPTITPQKTPTVVDPNLIKPVEPDKVIQPSTTTPQVVTPGIVVPGVFRILPPCHPKSNKALIFDCLEDDANVVSPKIWQQVRERLISLGFTVTTRLNNDASLANAALIDDGEYGLVFMRGHGGVVGSDFGFLVRPWYNSPPPYSSGYTGTVPASAYNHAIGATQYGYIITGGFSSAYWTNKTFPDTLFFLESCHGTDPGGLPGMPTWTTNHGASAWIGWDESVSFGCGDNGTSLFFQKIAEKATVGDALGAVFATGCRPPDLTVHPSNRSSCRLPLWIVDPNESTVADNRDFKRLKLVATTSNLFADVEFYNNPAFDEFFFYASTDADAGAEVLIRCHPSDFEVYLESGSGSYTNKVYTGTPISSGASYSLTIPWTTAFGSASFPNTKFWLYDMSGGDRLPNTPPS